MSDFNIDRTALRALLEGPSGPVVKMVERTTARVETAAKRRCPVDTGRLRASIGRDREVSGDVVVGIVGTNVDYALPVEFNTRSFLRAGLHEVITGGLQ